MDKRPLFLGKGHGRGRGNEKSGAKPSRPAGRTGGNHVPSISKRDCGSVVIGGGKSPKATEASKERVEKADKIKESAKRYMEKAEDEIEDSSEDEEINDSEILNNTFKNYKNTSQGINILNAQ